MRNNQPVTNNEYEIRPDSCIVSKTDTKGKITWFNKDFVDAAGFTPEELMGQPHNIVRHPDMPTEAFADLWNSFKLGRPWAGAVKNRRKNGDFYWVYASATPIWENGQLTGYMSVRSALSREKRAAFESVYRLFREGKAGKMQIENGRAVVKSAWSRFNIFTRTIRSRLTTQIAVSGVLTAAIGIAGLVALYDSNLRLKTVYEDRTIPSTQIAEINDRMRDNVMLLSQAAAEERELANGKPGRPVTEFTTGIDANTAAITKVWSAYTATAMTPEEQKLADRFVENRRNFVTKGLNEGVALAKAHKSAELDRHIGATMLPLYQTAKSDAEALLKLQIDVAAQEYQTAARHFTFSLLAVLSLIVVSLVAGVMLGFFTLRAVSRPLQQLNETVKSIAKGNYNNDIEITSEDEMAEPLRNIRAMQTKMGFDMHTQREAAADTERRMQKLDTLTKNFDAQVTTSLGALDAASGELRTTANSMSSTAEETQRQSTAVAAAAEQASTNVQTVASAAEELSSSIAEITRQVAQSTRIAGKASADAEQTNLRVQGLAQAAQKIGDVVKLINDVAGQTNLLALNATIEAARAGDAGKGFAVVAAEVKSLANQTAKATEDIAAQVGAIQSATGGTVDAIRSISATITEINEIATAIASAVEEQGAATQEIARNVQQASQGTGEVSSNISGVSQAAVTTGQAATKVIGATGKMTEQGEHLRQEVTRFLAEVKAA